MAEGHNPFDVRPDGHNVVLEFYAYGRYVLQSQVFDAVMKAEHVAYARPREELVGTQPLQYWVDDVQLMLTPGEQLTWGDWSTALWAMRLAVVGKGMCFEWYFGIARAGTPDDGPIGYGTLKTIRPEVATSKG
ncbi:hypothetical protein ACLMJK_004695 [Lecanora helva]